MQGEMTVTYRLRDVDGGTEVVGIHQGLPAAVSREDNDLGRRRSMTKLAALVESRT